MIVDERMTVYINSLDGGNGDLDEVERQARRDGVPILRKETQSFLKTLLRLKKPEDILEVGTAVGFSALLMCENTPESCRVTTIEKYEPYIERAKENFCRAGRESRVTLLEGDAADLLKELGGSFDFIFMDAAKGQYLSFLPDVLRLLAPGGLLLSDNVLQEGELIESHFLVERRNRTIHKRMREYLYALTHDARLQTSIVPVGDGMAVSVRVK